MWGFMVYYYNLNVNNKYTRKLIEVDTTPYDSMKPCIIWQAAISKAYNEMPDGFDAVDKIELMYD